MTLSVKDATGSTVSLATGSGDGSGTPYKSPAAVGIGDVSDAQATSASASWSVIALLKALFTSLLGGATYTKTTTISSGQTVSAEIDLGGTTPVALITPAALTGTTVTFQAATTTGGTFNTVMKDGATLSVTVAASRFVVLQPSDFAGVRFLKVVSGSSEGADRTLTLATRYV